jgi:hypothetical protein
MPVLTLNHSTLYSRVQQIGACGRFTRILAYDVHDPDQTDTGLYPPIPKAKFGERVSSIS